MKCINYSFFWTNFQEIRVPVALYFSSWNSLKHDPLKGVFLKKLFTFSDKYFSKCATVSSFSGGSAPAKIFRKKLWVDLLLEGLFQQTNSSYHLIVPFSCFRIIFLETIKLCPSIRHASSLVGAISALHKSMFAPNLFLEIKDAFH